MRERGGGAIVNIGSISATNPASDHSHYNSAKAAVLAFTRSCAQELGPFGDPGQLRVAGAHPQGRASRKRLARRRRTLARKVPLGRLGEPEDIADACLFLASPAARWISGQNLAVDGGVLATRIY